MESQALGEQALLSLCEGKEVGMAVSVSLLTSRFRCQGQTVANQESFLLHLD